MIQSINCQSSLSVTAVVYVSHRLASLISQKWVLTSLKQYKRSQSCKSWSTLHFKTLRTATATPYTHREWLPSQVKDRWDTWQRYVLPTLLHLLHPLLVRHMYYSLPITHPSTTNMPVIARCSSEQRLLRAALPSRKSPYPNAPNPQTPCPHPCLHPSKTARFAAHSRATWTPSNSTPLFQPPEHAALQREKSLSPGAVLNIHLRTIFSVVHHLSNLASRTSRESFPRLMRSVQSVRSRLHGANPHSLCKQLLREHHHTRPPVGMILQRTPLVYAHSLTM